MFNMFPDEDRFGRLFKRLLPVGALFSVPLLLLLGVLVLLGRTSVDVFGNQIGGIWGFLICIALMPPSIACLAVIGAAHLYFGRRIPILRDFLPRIPDNKNKRETKSPPLNA
jgi:hypothetical protein